jgi:uncharacterized protein (TIGR02284 family)
MLNDLTGKNLGFADGYRVVASLVRNRDVTSVLSEIAHERRRAAGQLQLAVRGIGGEPAWEPAGGLQRRWLAWHARLSPNNPADLVEDVKAAEVRMLSSYRGVLAHGSFSRSVRELLNDQQENTSHALKRLEQIDIEGEKA